MNMKSIAGLLLTVGISANVQATPLSVDYVVTDLGGLYQYDFTITLDNNDGSWTLGNEWDWFILGDNDYADNYNGFDTNGGASGGVDWNWLSSPAGTSTSSSGGGHNGPTVYFGSSAALPGWMPATIGDSFSVSGTSSLLIPTGELYWSALQATGGASPVYYELANQGDGNDGTVPEPATLALLGLGLAGLGFSRRTRR